MPNIILRQDLGNTEPRSANVVVKNSGLSNIELDNNFNNINNNVEYNSGNIDVLFNQVSSAYNQANSAFLAANNSASAEPAFNRANSAYDQANTAILQSQAAFATANNVAPQIEPAFNQANTGVIQAQAALESANTKFSSSGGNISGPVEISSNLLVTGNLTVSGNVTTVSANNLVLQDNMIYLNDGSTISNPDLGLSGNYNDGKYHHTGFFRDASDGIWKVFDQYEPEPDSSPYIDTSNSTFRIADFQANNIYANTFSGIANNSNYLNGKNDNYFIVYINDIISSNVNILQDINLTQNSSITSAFNQANTGVIQAQAAFATANNVAPQIEPAFNQANLAYNQANTGTTQAQAAFGQANTGTTQAQASFGRANSAFNQANTGTTQAQAAFAAANNEPIAKSAFGQANLAFGQANTGTTQAQASFGRANSAFNQANTANTNAANASFLSTGTVPTARLASGTANSTTFLRGDSTWQTVSGFSSTDDTSTNATYYPVVVTAAGGSTARTSSTKLYFNPSTGTLSSTRFNSLSDQKFKENISPIDSGIAVLEQLNPVKFSWKDTKEYSHGFIAQELEKIIPESVSENDGIKSVNYDSIIPFLVKAIQELRAEIDQLKSKINS